MPNSISCCSSHCGLTLAARPPLLLAAGAPLRSATCPRLLLFQAATRSESPTAGPALTGRAQYDVLSVPLPGGPFQNSRGPKQFQMRSRDYESGLTAGHSSFTRSLWKAEIIWQPRSHILAAAKSSADRPRGTSLARTRASCDSRRPAEQAPTSACRAFPAADPHLNRLSQGSPSSNWAPSASRFLC